MIVDSAPDEEADDSTTERLSGRDFYSKQAGQYPLLSPEEEALLASRIRAGDREARDTLVRHNLRLALSFAYRYSSSSFSLDFEDLMQAGSMGLMSAAEKFDPVRGRFATYAVWWIRQFIVREFEAHSRDVRPPAAILQWGKKIFRVQRELAQKLRREPTPEELTTALHESTGEEVLASTVTDAIHRTEVSLDAPLGDEDDRSLYDIMQGASNHQSPEVLLLARDEIKMLVDDVQRMIRILQASPKPDQWLRLFAARYNIHSSEGFECRNVPVPAGGSAKPSLQSMWRYLNTQGVTGNDAEFAARITRAQYIESVIGIKSACISDASQKAT